MTIPTPGIFAGRKAAAPTVVDTRCGATKVSGQRTYTCSRHGEHDRHIDCKHNVVWSDSKPGA